MSFEDFGIEDDTKACKISPASNHQAIAFDFYDLLKNSLNPKARDIGSLHLNLLYLGIYLLFLYFVAYVVVTMNIIFALQEMFQGVEFELTSCEMETHLDEMNTNMVEAKESLNIVAEQVERTMKHLYKRNIL
ncbi:hypothetical protein K1719_010917 [Acacia pycnantha]|nr:hypothetical protein K1719_010917 [Acacia pycnantha]